MKIDLISNELFGNEAGEDEPVEILRSYYLEKPEYEIFYSDAVKMQIVRSRKGVGKSALLKHTWDKKVLNKRDDILINVKASELTSLIQTSTKDPLEMINIWQQRICFKINSEIGKRINVALDDDSIALIENAEIGGFKGKNLVSALSERIISIPVKTRKFIPANQFELLKRYAKRKNYRVWLFIDDIDATFKSSFFEKLSISTFFTACRYLTTDVKGLYIRASIRTDVWSMLAKFDESLDKSEQYVLDLKWSTKDTGVILGNKIVSYFERKGAIKKNELSMRKDVDTIYGLVFTETFKWAGGRHIPYKPIHILSAGRPRWAGQLCKFAAKEAYKRNKEYIGIGEVNSVLRDYGKYRLSDLYKEHDHQCPDLVNIIEAFSNGVTQYSTERLLSYIDEKILSITPSIEIDGDNANVDNVAIARFLFRIGFIALRKEGKILSFVYFDDRPDLLKTKANLDDNCKWEIHPSYRQVLNLKH